MDTANLRDQIQTLKAAIYPADCDVMGHMNIARYVALFDQSAQHLFLNLGNDPAEARKGQWGWADVKLTISYRHEVGAGELITIGSRPTRVGRRSITHTHTMTNSANGTTLAIAEFVTVRFDLQRREASALPEEFARRARTLIEAAR